MDGWMFLNFMQIEENSRTNFAICMYSWFLAIRVADPVEHGPDPSIEWRKNRYGSDLIKFTLIFFSLISCYYYDYFFFEFCSINTAKISIWVGFFLFQKVRAKPDPDTTKASIQLCNPTCNRHSSEFHTKPAG